MPEISVVMPVYNGEKYLREAIESTLNQTFEDFEFIIICEYGTSEESFHIVKEYAQKDNRICIIQNNKRLGISASLNIGMRKAKGKYIARMDGDDVNGIRRFEIQKLFMDLYPDIGICGIRHKVINSPKWLVDFNADPEQIKTDLIFFPSLRHPSIMYRHSVIKENDLYYDETLMGAEDYELYIRANKVTKITNILNDGLFYHRRTEENASLVYRERDDQIQEKLLHKQFLDEFGLDFTKEELKILSITSTFTGEKKTKYKEIISKLNLLMIKIYEKNEKLENLNSSNLWNTMCHRWQRVRYSLNVIYNYKIPSELLNKWKEGFFYQKWMN